MANRKKKAKVSLFRTSAQSQGWIEEIRKKGKDTACKEVKQLNDGTVWKPIQPNDLTKDEKWKATESLIFLTEKRDRTTKGRMHANGNTKISCVPKEEASRPMATNEYVLITSMIDVKQERDVASMEIPNAFVQTKVQQGDERIIMKIRGALVDMLQEIDLENANTS